MITYGESTVRTYIPDDDIQEHARDVERVIDTLVAFLRRNVQDNIYHLGQHRCGFENDERSFEHEFEKYYHRIARKVVSAPNENAFANELEGVFEMLMEYLDRPTADLLRQLFQMQVAKNTHSVEYRRLHWCALIVMLVGLGSFLEYGHCLNKCAEALVYSDRNEVRFSVWGKSVPEFARLCTHSHEMIEKALEWYDLRDMDRLLQEASAIARKGAKVCSLMSPTPEVAKHKLGTLPGLKNTARPVYSPNGSVAYYVNRLGTKYVLNPDGLLQKTNGINP
jgi:hypothetical protein